MKYVHLICWILFISLYLSFPKLFFLLIGEEFQNKTIHIKIANFDSINT